MPCEQEKPESSEDSLPKEIFDQRHFYAAYIYDHPQDREKDISQLIELALVKELPVRYWWLSDAINIGEEPDTLIVCVHHQESHENAGMDLYGALEEVGVKWDMMEAASMHEYLFLGRKVDPETELAYLDGKSLFPEGIPSFLHAFKHKGTAATQLILSDQRMSKLPIEARMQMQQALEQTAHTFLLLLAHSEEFEREGFPLHESYQLLNAGIKKTTSFFEKVIGYEPPEIPY